MVEEGDDVKFLTFEGGVMGGGGGGGLQKSNKCEQGQRGDLNFGDNVKFCENVITK